jgi:protein-tyrosine phosphatase
MLPSPRSDSAYRIAVVCLGNICRSPIAEVVLTARIEEAGLADRVLVDSWGTGNWHVGGAMDTRSATTLSGSGYDATRHRARQFLAGHVDDHDLVLAMDRSNLADLRRLGVDPDRLRLFRDFDPEPDDGEVPDPYYGGESGFHDVLAMVERTAECLVAELRALLVEADARP